MTGWVFVAGSKGRKCKARKYSQIVICAVMAFSQAAAAK